MALTTPILYQVAAFDATSDQIFTFNVVGGSQVTQNTLTIRNNSTGATVYQQTVTSYVFQHTLPANSLTNNTYYNATIITLDSQGNKSQESQPIQFYCYTTPTVTITNMPVNNYVQNSSFEFQAQYDQIENELLNSYRFDLYDTSNTIVSTSGTIYLGTPTEPPNTFSHLFSGFSDGGQYYIEVTCQTVNNTMVTTGRISFLVNYEFPNIYSIVSLENNMCGGYITITSNMVSIEGQSNPDPPKYVDDNTMVDLTEEGSWVLYPDGYEVTGDFTIGLWGKSFQDYQNILTMWSDANTDADPFKLTLRFMPEYKANDDTKYCYFDMYVYSGNSVPAYVYSNSLEYPAPTQEITIFIRRQSNIFEIYIEPYTAT